MEASVGFTKHCLSKYSMQALTFAGVIFGSSGLMPCLSWMFFSIFCQAVNLVLESAAVGFG